MKYRHVVGAGVLGALTSVFVGAQTSPSPGFVSVSIRRAGASGRAGVHMEGSDIRWTYLSLKDYLEIAYGMRSYQISEAGWIARERFDITATVPSDAIPAEVPSMLQQMLQERFQLRLHRENRELAVFCLALGKGGSKLEESAPTASAETQGTDVAVNSHPGDVTVNYGDGASFKFAGNRLEARRLRMAAIADALSKFTDRPVIDMTSLTGRYDFVLQLSPGDFRAMRIRSAMASGATVTQQAIREAEASSGDSLFKAIQKLGLELEPRQGRVDMLVIDHVETLPAVN